MAETLPKLVDDVLQQQHQQLLDRLDAWWSRVERSLEVKMRDVQLLERAGISAVSVTGTSPGYEDEERAISHGAVSVPVSVPHSLDADNSQNGQSPTASRKAATHAHDYEEAKEEGHRVETLKRMMSESEALKSASRHASRASQCLRGCHQWAAAISSSVTFNLIVAVIIISNSAFLGVQLEWSVHDDSESAASWFLFGHFCYAVLFTVEMAIRIAAVGPRVFCCGPDWGWNWLDVSIVLPAWLELILDFMAAQSNSGGGATSNFRIIRVFRITRVLQVIRSVRLIRFISAFRELVISVIDTVRQLVWAMVLLVLIIYSFGLIFTDAVLQHVVENPHDTNLTTHFGGVYTSCTTLFRTLMAGFDWIVAADALMPLGVMWVQLFHVYVAFGGFALLNVITGVFVNSAIKTREKDHETLMQHVHQFKVLVQNLWGKLDTSGLGQITISEFEDMFQNEDMIAFFEAIEVNAVDAWTLFDSLDADGDHLISYEEFSQRCFQLHGNARSVDLFALRQQASKLEDQLDSLAQAQERTHSVLNLLATGKLGEASDEMQTFEMKWAPGEE